MRIWLLLLALLTPVTAQSHLSVTGPAAVELYELAPMAPPAPIIKARSAVLVDLDSGKTLYQVDPHGRHAPRHLRRAHECEGGHARHGRHALRQPDRPGRSRPLHVIG